MFFGIFRILIALFVLVTPVWAEAHPGTHVNPHIPNVVLFAAIGFLVLAWATMAAYLVGYRIRARRAQDELIRSRLNLARARVRLAHAQRLRAYWTAQLETWRRIRGL